MINKIKKIILNHLLSQNDWMQTTLIHHQNKIIVIEISDLKTIFKVNEIGLLQSINESEVFDCSIKLTVNDFFNQLIKNKNTNISIEGDLDLAKDVSEVLKKIRLDVEEDLSSYIGDLPALHTTNILKKVATNSKKNIKNIAGSLLEYWQEENQIIAKKRNLENFNRKVDEIVESTERFEARIEKIIKKTKS